MLRTEDWMELTILRRHGESHSGSGADDGQVEPYGSAVFA